VLPSPALGVGGKYRHCGPCFPTLRALIRGTPLHVAECDSPRTLLAAYRLSLASYLAPSPGFGEFVDEADVNLAMTQLFGRAAQRTVHWQHYPVRRSPPHAAGHSRPLGHPNSHAAEAYQCRNGLRSGQANPRDRCLNRWIASRSTTSRPLNRCLAATLARGWVRRLFLPFTSTDLSPIKL
jgi:hypothetical protein